MWQLDITNWFKDARHFTYFNNAPDQTFITKLLVRLTQTNTTSWTVWDKNKVEHYPVCWQKSCQQQRTHNYLFSLQSVHQVLESLWVSNVCFVYLDGRWTGSSAQHSTPYRSTCHRSHEKGFNSNEMKYDTFDICRFLSEVKVSRMPQNSVNSEIITYPSKPHIRRFFSWDWWSFSALFPKLIDQNKLHRHSNLSVSSFSSSFSFVSSSDLNTVLKWSLHQLQRGLIAHSHQCPIILHLEENQHNIYSK